MSGQRTGVWNSVGECDTFLGGGPKRVASEAAEQKPALMLRRREDVVAQRYSTYLPPKHCLYGIEAISSNEGRSRERRIQTISPIEDPVVDSRGQLAIETGFPNMPPSAVVTIFTGWKLKTVMSL